MPESPLAVKSGTAASLIFAELSDRSYDAVTSFWLSEPSARSVLNEQLALILRAIAEGRGVADEALFSFCPICGGELSEYKSDDMYALSLRCPVGHDWGLRGGRLGTVMDGTLVALQAEYSGAVLHQLISSWLKGDLLLERQLHASIRHVLTDFLASRTGPPQS